METCRRCPLVKMETRRPGCRNAGGFRIVEICFATWFNEGFSTYTYLSTDGKNKKEVKCQNFATPTPTYLLTLVLLGFNISYFKTPSQLQKRELHQMRGKLRNIEDKREIVLRERRLLTERVDSIVKSIGEEIEARKKVDGFHFY